MEKTFSCRIDEDIYDTIKEKLRIEGLTIREWLVSKIIEDVKPQTDDGESKITDFQDKYIRATPHFYAKRSSWIHHLAFVVKDKEAIIEFESRMRMLAKDWNRIYSIKDNPERMKRYLENQKAVVFL